MSPADAILLSFIGVALLYCIAVFSISPTVFLSLPEKMKSAVQQFLSVQLGIINEGKTTGRSQMTGKGGYSHA
jgi:hypothetical protein